MIMDILFDVKQGRLYRDRLAILVAGEVPGVGAGELGVAPVDGWDSPYVSNAWYDPFTKTVFLKPAPLLPDWSSVGTGIYSRLRKVDYTLISPSKWVEANKKFNGDVYLEALDVNEVVVTKIGYEKNRGFFLGWFEFTTSDDDFVSMECGWATGEGMYAVDDPSTYVGLRFWAKGKVEVWRYGAFVGEYVPSIPGEVTGVKKSKKDPAGDDKANVAVGYVLLPFRRRDLLVIRQDKAGFVHTFEDITEDDPGPTITGNGAQFFWNKVSGKASVQCAPLSFPTSGYITSVEMVFREAPKSGSSPVLTVYADAPGYGTSGATAVLRKVDNSANFVADGRETRCRVRVDLTGDGKATQFVLGVMAEFPGEVVDTSDEEIKDVTDLINEVELSVPDGGADSVLKLTTKNLRQIDDLGVVGYAWMANRPVRIEMGDGVILWDGRVDPPEFVDGIIAEDYDTKTLIYECRDGWKALEGYIFRDPTPLDGKTLTDAIIFVLKTAGFDDLDLDVEEIDFVLPSGGSMRSVGEWAELIQVGDSASEVIKRLVDKYVPRSFYGFKPYKGRMLFFLKRWETALDEEPRAVLYRTWADAQSAGISPAYKGVYRSYRDNVLEPEANEVWVTGLDPRSRKPVQRFARDRESQDPTLLPSVRPYNWLGEPRLYGWVDPSIQNADAAERACRLLFERLTGLRFIAQWECEFVLDDQGIPLWRGDRIRLDGLGDYIITSLSGNFKSGNDLFWGSNPFIYTGELIPSTAGFDLSMS